MSSKPQISPEGPMYLVTKERILIGTCVHMTFKGGWIFHPHMTSRRPGRKAHLNAVSCIPGWAFDLSDDFLTMEEWKAENKKAA